MAISKPSWLRSWFSTLNWDILNFHVYVGDAVEAAIDWAIDWINWGIDQADSAYSKAQAAWDKAIDVGREAWNNLQAEAWKLWSKIDTWWTDLGTWWETKVDIVKGWIDVAKSALQGSIAWVQQQFNSLSVTWSNFWYNTWPQWTRDFNALLTSVSNFFTVTLPELASRLDITQALKDFKLEWKDLFNFWGSLGKDVMSFFTNPVDWLWDRVFDYLDKRW